MSPYKVYYLFQSTFFPTEGEAVMVYADDEYSKTQRESTVKFSIFYLMRIEKKMKLSVTYIQTYKLTWPSIPLVFTEHILARSWRIVLFIKTKQSNLTTLPHSRLDPSPSRWKKSPPSLRLFAPGITWTGEWSPYSRRGLRDPPWGHTQQGGPGGGRGYTPESRALEGKGWSRKGWGEGWRGL